jgi:Mg2+/Co2+ transporter CorC
MQSYHEKELVDAFYGKAEELTKRFDELGDKVTHAVIGKMPAKGQEVSINGLVFVVYNTMDNGNVFLTLKKPKEQP